MDMHIPNEAKISYRQVQLSSRHTSTHMYCTSWTKEERRKETLSFFWLPLKRREKKVVQRKVSFQVRQRNHQFVLHSSLNARTILQINIHSVCRKKRKLTVSLFFPLTLKLIASTVDIVYGTIVQVRVRVVSIDASECTKAQCRRRYLPTCLYLVPAVPIGRKITNSIFNSSFFLIFASPG